MIGEYRHFTHHWVKTCNRLISTVVFPKPNQLRKLCLRFAVMPEKSAQYSIHRFLV